MMSLTEKIRREDILLRLIVLIFMGAALNTLALVFTLEEVGRELQMTTFSQTPSIPFITTAPHVTVTYLALGTVFSIGASLSFTPKRIVSPIYVQAITATMLLIIIHAYYYYSNAPVLSLQFLGGESIIVGMFYGILMGVGWLQREFVRKMIGVNGTRENIDVKTYSINVGYDEFIEVFNRRFLFNFDLNKKQDDTSVLLLQSKFGSVIKHVIVVTTDPDDKKKTILSITSYLIRNDWLASPRDVSDREWILGGIERMLRIKNPNVLFAERVDDKVATNKAVSQTLKLTSSRFGDLRNYPRRHMVLLGAFISITIGVVVGHIYNIINNDTLTNSIVFLVIIFLVEALPLLREKIDAQKSKEQ